MKMSQARSKTREFGAMLVVLPAATAALALLVATNVAQNGSVAHKAPPVGNLDDVLQLKTKADFVAAWRTGSVPANYGGRSYDGYLLSLGILAPVSAFITNVLFAPFAAWRGKSFRKDGRAGRNRFGDAGDEIRGFAASAAASRLDGQEALVLDYSDPKLPDCSQNSVKASKAVSKSGCIVASRKLARHGDALWGRVLFMRDELREVAPGVLLGLGSMGATGGIQNCAPFVLVQSKQPFDM